MRRVHKNRRLKLSSFEQLRWTFPEVWIQSLGRRATYLASLFGQDRLVEIVTHGTDGWTFTESRPRRLSGFVESIWYFEGSIPQARERHFPNGLLELVVQLTDRFHFVKDGIRERCAPNSLAGLQTGPTFIEAPPGRARVLGIRLHPAGAYAVVGRALHEMKGRVVDLEDLIGRPASELAERCSEAVGPEARVRCAAHWISDRINRSSTIDPRVAWAAARIEGSHGLVQIAWLQDQTGLSRKRLVEGFREQIGLTPKLYARILRFRFALTLLHDGGCSLAETALAAGYYDQPHMNLEFRDLGGLPPGDFLATTRSSPTSAID
jgi:AraC-like DNA-binding protein